MPEPHEKRDQIYIREIDYYDVDRIMRMLDLMELK